MKSLTLIYTVPMIIDPINKMVQKEIPSINIYNLYDDKILSLFDQSLDIVKDRFQKLVDLSKDSDLIVVTCSSLSRIAKEIDPSIILVDEYMFKATQSFNKILLVATAPTTLDPSMKGIREHNKNAQINTLHVLNAIESLKIGDKNKHDNLVLDAIKQEISKNEYDCIVMAQASLAHLQDQIEEISKLKVLTNIIQMIQQIKQEIAHANK